MQVPLLLVNKGKKSAEVYAVKSRIIKPAMIVLTEQVEQYSQIIEVNKNKKVCKFTDIWIF